METHSLNQSTAASRAIGSGNGATRPNILPLHDQLAVVGLVRSRSLLCGRHLVSIEYAMRPSLEVNRPPVVVYFQRVACVVSQNRSDAFVDEALSQRQAGAGKFHSPLPLLRWIWTSPWLLPPSEPSSPGRRGAHLAGSLPTAASIVQRSHRLAVYSAFNPSVRIRSWRQLLKLTELTAYLTSNPPTRRGHRRGFASNVLPARFCSLPTTPFVSIRFPAVSSVRSLPWQQIRRPAWAKSKTFPTLLPSALLASLVRHWLSLTRY